MAPLWIMLLVGVASSQRWGNQGNTSPITASDQVRICANLCSAGLGGAHCGEFCQDLLPKTLPRQSFNSSDHVKRPNARSGVCPILCENGLGYPLCRCHSLKLRSANDKAFKIDFKKICDHYCQQQRWWLRGCPVCEAGKQDGGVQQNGRMGKSSGVLDADDDIDWEKWCDLQCAQSNGGSACNCDILPLSLV